MPVEMIHWGRLCEEKDQRIKELEGKFVEIVNRLEAQRNTLCDPNWNAAIIAAISIVEFIGEVPKGE